MTGEKKLLPLEHCSTSAHAFLDLFVLRVEFDVDAAQPAVIGAHGAVLVLHQIEAAVVAPRSWLPHWRGTVEEAGPPPGIIRSIWPLETSAPIFVARTIMRLPFSFLDPGSWGHSSHRRGIVARQEAPLRRRRHRDEAAAQARIILVAERGLSSTCAPPRQPERSL